MGSAYDIMNAIEDAYYDIDKLRLLDAVSDWEWENMSFDYLKFFVDFRDALIERLAAAKESW